MKIIVPINSYPTRNRKFQKLKNTITASFQAKPGWERPRKRENKNYRSYQFLPDPEQRIQKKQQNTIRASLQSKTGWERQRKEENKNYRSDHLPLDPYQRIRKIYPKKSKNYKTPLGLLQEPKHIGKGREKEKRKILFRSIATRPVIENSKTIAKKFKKL